jgi:hypothetical protein
MLKLHTDEPALPELSVELDASQHDTLCVSLCNQATAARCSMQLGHEATHYPVGDDTGLCVSPSSCVRRRTSQELRRDA